MFNTFWFGFIIGLVVGGAVERANAAEISMCGSPAQVETTLERMGEVALISYADEMGIKTLWGSRDGTTWTLTILDPATGQECTMRNGRNIKYL